MKYLINTFKRNTYLIKLALPIFLELILQMLIGSVDQLMLTGNKTAVNGIIQANTLTNLVLIVFFCFIDCFYYFNYSIKCFR